MRCASTSRSPAASRAARKLAGLADAWGLRVELQSWGYTLIQAANLHFGLACEHSGYFELPVPHEPYEYGVENPYRIQAGRLRRTRPPRPASASSSTGSAWRPRG